MTIKSFSLKGHKSSVSCLDYSSSLLLSGSEDGTARVWDLRTCKTALCIRTARGEVTSVAFFPHEDGAPPPGGTFAKNFSVYLSVDSAILEYDLRQASTPIVQQPTRDLTENFQTTEEVNQLSVSSKRMLLAAADDAGCVRIWDGTRLRQLQPGDPSAARRRDPFLMTCCGFRSGDQLASGGTDCCVYLWDTGRPRRPLDSFAVEASGDAGANRACNPPMVHSIAWSPSGRLLAAGLGDGSIQVLGVQKKKLVDLARLSEGHKDSVASLCFPQFTGSHNKADRLLASAGTDGAILLWDLKRSVGGDSAMDSRKILSSYLVGEELLQSKDPELLFGIPHEHKANWIVSSQTDTLFVADTTNDITGYSLPLR